MPENNNIMSIEGQLIGMPLAGPESFSQQQLDYLKRALGVDETVLWTGTIGAPGSTGDLSEAITNFEFVEVYAEPVYGGMCPVVTRFATISSKNSVRFGTFSQDGGSTYLANYTVDFSGTSVSVARSKRISINNSNGSISVTDNDATGSYKAPITKIVGIHRIAGGN